MSDQFVYFIKPVGMDGPIKIGCSWKPVDRLQSLACWSPYPLEIAATVDGGFSLEWNIQNCFADSHSHHEWFHATPRLLAAVEALKAGVPVHEAIDLNDTRGDLRAAHYAERSRRHWAKVGQAA